MGITMTKAQPRAAVRKKRKQRTGFLPVIHEYVPEPHRHRTDSDLNHRLKVKFKSLSQYDRSATVFDVRSNSSGPRPETPDWQRKWERDMRPTPSHIRLKDLPHLRAWNSMPLPTNDIDAYFIDWHDSFRRTPNAQKETKRTKGSVRGSVPKLDRTNNRQSSTPFSDTREPEVADRMSLSSMSVDSSKWLHKTDARTDNYLKFVAGLWSAEPRRGSKQWFLGQETKVEQETVPKRSKRRNRLRIKQTSTLPPIKA